VVRRERHVELGPGLGDHVEVGQRRFDHDEIGAFGQVQAASAAGEQKAVKSATAEDAAQILDNASTVVVVPGYGLAVYALMFDRLQNTALLVAALGLIFFKRIVGGRPWRV